MGAYLSTPTRKVVHLEPTVPTVPSITSEIPQVILKPMEAIHEEGDILVLEAPSRAEPKDAVEPKDAAETIVRKECIQTKEILPLMVHVPTEVESEPIVPASPAPRVPEFRGQSAPESAAIKKFNRRHRKHS